MRRRTGFSRHLSRRGARRPVDACSAPTGAKRRQSGQHYVFVVPVKSELDLKKAAKAAGEKAVSMIKQKELLTLTGYVHGGCSPIGMKKQFPTFIHESAKHFDRMFVSAGKVGFQIELSPQDLVSVTGCSFADIAEEGL